MCRALKTNLVVGPTNALIPYVRCLPEADKKVLQFYDATVCSEYAWSLG